VLEEPRRPERDCDREPRYEERPGLHLGAADVHEAGRADAVERQRIGEDVARALEDGADERADREGHGGGPRDPADRRSTAEVRLDEADVGRRAGQHAHCEPDDQREDELRLVRAALADRRGASENEQRREDPEPDEVAEGEMHDPGEPVDQRVPSSEEPVDPTGGEPRDDDLQGDRHGRKVLPATGGASAVLRRGSRQWPRRRDHRRALTLDATRAMRRAAGRSLLFSFSIGLGWPRRRSVGG
jgi:hypothetical protein